MVNRQDPPVCSFDRTDESRHVPLNNPKEDLPALRVIIYPLELRAVVGYHRWTQPIRSLPHSISTFNDTLQS